MMKRKTRALRHFLLVSISVLCASLSSCDSGYNEDAPMEEDSQEASTAKAGGTGDKGTSITSPPSGGEAGSPVSGGEQGEPNSPGTTDPEDHSISPEAAKAQAIRFVGELTKAKVFRLQEEVQRLVQLIEDHCFQADLATAESVRMQWLEVMSRWQFLSAFQLGPALADEERISYNIYSGVSNACGIDREIMAADADAPYTLKDQGSLTTLSALEYLFFETEYKNACRSQPPLDTWNDKPLPERMRLRCHYGQLVALRLKGFVDELAQAWQTPIVMAPYLDTTAAEKQQDIWEKIITALFYLDEVKNVKIRIPARYGKYQDPYCNFRPCPRNVEHYYSRSSKSSVIANLKGFRAVITGTDPQGETSGSHEADADVAGILSYLKAMDEDQVGRELMQATDSALKNLENEPRSFYQLAEQSDLASCELTTISERLEPFCAIYKDFQRLYEQLSGEFMEVVEVKLPTSRSAGDGD